MKKVFLWIISVLCGLIALLCLTNLPASWGGLLFAVPAVLINPKIRDLFEQKNVKLKWPAYLAAFLVPFVCFTGSMVALSPAQPVEQAPSSLVSSAPISASSLASSDKTISSKPAPSTASTSVALASSQPVPTVQTDAKLKVHYLDVGQGDSEFVELPNGQTMLIDAGNPENGPEIISYIKNLKHNKIDYLIATHPHADHIGGMADVINALTVGQMYMPRTSEADTPTTATYKGLLSTIKSKGVSVHTAKAGVSLFSAGNLSANLIAPCSTDYNDLNQYSAVMMLQYGDDKFLFTGDAGEPSESQITANVKADVLKVGHHGSSTSTSQAFLNKVKPKYAVIEVGAGNSYGHPTAATLSKLQNIGATIYRTDKDGTIIFTSDAKTITVDKKASTVKPQAPPSSNSATGTAGVVTGASSKSNGETVSKPTPPANNGDEITVYITDTGKKYHRDGCRYLNKSKHAISLSDAKAQGYEPCSVCDPPQ